MNFPKYTLLIALFSSLAFFPLSHSEASQEDHEARAQAWREYHQQVAEEEARREAAMEQWQASKEADQRKREAAWERADGYMDREDELQKRAAALLSRREAREEEEREFFEERKARAAEAAAAEEAWHERRRATLIRWEALLDQMEAVLGNLEGSAEDSPDSPE